MDQIERSQIGGLGPELPDSGEPPRKVSRLLLLWPLLGFVGLFCDMITYRPLDDTLIYCIGAIPCGITWVFITIAWRKAQSGKDVRSFFPRAIWLAIVCLAVPIALLVNGALDQTPIEKHRQTITRTILEHGRGGVDYYYVECLSWRGRSHEKLMVSEGWYLEAKPGDPAIIETRKGALGIPLLVSAHRPD